MGLNDPGLSNFSEASKGKISFEMEVLPTVREGDRITGAAKIRMLDVGKTLDSLDTKEAYIYVRQNKHKLGFFYGIKLFYNKIVMCYAIIRTHFFGYELSITN